MQTIREGKKLIIIFVYNNFMVQSDAKVFPELPTGVFLKIDRFEIWFASHVRKVIINRFKKWFETRKYPE